MQILVIGIGAGDPEQLTLQAVAALNRVDVFFVLDKGDVKQELVDLRTEILQRHASGYQVVIGRDPDRDRTTTAYVEAVDDWRRRRADVCAELIAANLSADQVGAFLVWGDPSLYDSTIRIVEKLSERLELDYDVLPGISAPQLLAARHRVVLHEVGRPVHVTTGRLLREAVDAGLDNIAVLLNARLDLDGLEDWQIWWGANLGTVDEALVAGTLGEVRGDIEKARLAAKEAAGWVMDVYLLRKPA